MTNLPADPATNQRAMELLVQNRDAEIAHIKRALDDTGNIGLWLRQHAEELTLAGLDRAITNLKAARSTLANALRDARCYEALMGVAPSPIEEAARAAVESSQPLAPVADPAPDRTVPDEPGPDRPSPDGPGRARTPVGRIVATTSTIHTDTKPVDVQPKGGAK